MSRASARNEDHKAGAPDLAFLNPGLGRGDGLVTLLHQHAGI